jgi:hypothetical protein
MAKQLDGRTGYSATKNKAAPGFTHLQSSGHAIVQRDGVVICKIKKAREPSFISVTV